jgi:hypothetical protein
MDGYDGSVPMRGLKPERSLQGNGLSARGSAHFPAEAQENQQTRKAQNYHGEETQPVR